jgi:transmembrane sensor
MARVNCLVIISKMDNDDIKLLLVKYITNQATDAEVKEVKRWIKLHPENELYFIELYDAWQNMLYAKPEIIDEEIAYNSFLNKIDPPEAPVRSFKWLGITAVVIVLVASCAWYFNRSIPVDKTANQIVAKKGSIRKIVLTDGTTVWLNAVSTIKYDNNFGKTNRTVYLEGEAFFDIAHGDNKVPFLVRTKNYTVRDIGTKFNLKAYPNDTFFETTVIKGEVAVEGNSGDNSQGLNRIYVKPHQVLKINYSDEHNEKEKLTASSSGAFNEVRVLQVDSAKMNVYDGWKDDVLIFDGSTLGEIAKVLERRYNVKITIANTEIKSIRYSGSFKNVPDINKVLLIIKQNTPVNYTIDGSNVTITKTN